MSLYYVVSYHDPKSGLVDLAHVDGGLKEPELRRVVQSLANRFGKRLEVRRSQAVVPHASSSVMPPRRNPSKKPKRAKAARSAKRAARAKRNPGRVTKAAKKMFKKWHGFASTNTIRWNGSRTIPANVVKLGELPEIVYRSNKWTGKYETYLHKTGTPRPILCCDPKGKQFYIVGGRMRATARGIVG